MLPQGQESQGRLPRPLVLLLLLNVFMPEFEGKVQERGFTLKLLFNVGLNGGFGHK